MKKEVYKELRRIESRLHDIMNENDLEHTKLEDSWMLLFIYLKEVKNKHNVR